MSQENARTKTRTTDEPEVSDRTIGFVGYALYIAAPFTGGLTALAAVIIAYIQRGNENGILRSHWTNIIRMFWTSFAVFVVIVGIWIMWMASFSAAFTAGQAPAMGSLITLTWAVWVIIRSVIGILDLNQGRAMGQPPGLFTGR
ncbi:hypothetical protein [Thioalkalivibrio sp. AKL8]|uniref:hypothetical protein n=1 Tax=Thioalkalivibrio sp. AKL8 TaxID=1158156 RepID=UPI00035F53A0|nr:hypothetical protein [Thioalkalivibrio sp. AKL8]